VGVGGVGSWAAEGLARTGVGEMTLIDMDVLVASNVNRQLPATDSNFGKSKIEVMAARIKEINPHIKLHLIDDFLSKDNVQLLIPNRAFQSQLKQSGKQLVVLDCVDDMNAKLALALHCRFNKLKLIMAGGAGGKTDPTQIQVADLKDTYQDPLLAKVRQRLRQDYGINRAMKEKFGIRCVFSSQPPIVDKSCQTGGLHCGGYGSAVAVTSVVGMMLVAEALK
jgi:tRNA A37 threonylcarbamoyladenosine dehydratase